MNVTESKLEVHLHTKSLVSRDNTRWAFALNEPNQPKRTAPCPHKTNEIVDWLDVEDAERYRPRKSLTFCNIYAYDFCCLNSTYIPRVWWKKKFIAKIVSGLAIDPIYQSNVFEINANSLHDWFLDFGEEFGWKQSKDISSVQNSANQGMVCVIIAKRSDLFRNGHMSVVVPETDSFKAERNDGEVIHPVESQAGSKTYKRIVKSHQWWMKDKFSSFSFWIHS